MITTCQRRVPFRWIFFAVLPWAVFTFDNGVMGAGFLYSLKKFAENPALLTFVVSLPGIISIFSVPVCNFLSDRIWTRFGRRKPFIASGFIGIALCLALMPLMPNFWSLVAVYAAFGLFNDIGGANGPMEPLSQEIVPPQQRGLSSGTLQWGANFVNMTFYFFALGRFDDVRFMSGVPVVGETMIYWIACLLVVIVLSFILLGIKEVEQKSELRGQRLSLKVFFAGLLDRELWPVFTLVFCSAMLNAGLGALGLLLYTDQWHYTKQEMGANVVVGSLINMVVIGFLAMIADRLDRMRAYQVLICIAIALKAGFYLYVECVLPDARPSLVEIIVFGEMLSMVAILTNMIYTPLVYDYVTRNKMGTYMAGASIVTRLTQLLTLNGVGLFLWAYAALFLPPAGDMVRVIMRDANTTRADVMSVIQHATWTSPFSATPIPATRISATPWNAPGNRTTGGSCWEIRLAGSGETDDKTNARELQKQVAQAFGDCILADGEQIRDAKWGQALVLQLPASGRPDAAKLEEILGALRKSFPDTIDLRPVKQSDGYAVAMSAVFHDAGDQLQFAQKMQAALEAVDPKLLMTGAALVHREVLPVVTMDLLTVEQPLDAYTSPIMRVVNGITSLWARAPEPDHRLVAMGHALRSPNGTDHVRVFATPDNARAITVMAVMRNVSDRTPGSVDAVRKRLRILLEGKGSSSVRMFYDRVVDAAAAQHLTVERPFVDVAYAPMQYDFMPGYIWMLLLGVGGFAITVAFRRREARGLIHKRGREEAQAAARADAERPEEKAFGGEAARVYVPGYARRKFAMVLCGVAISAFGVSQMATPLRLLCFGVSATAEASTVVVSKTGVPDEVLTSDKLIEATEGKDRRMVFWNEFQFQGADGNNVTIRANVGSVSKPRYPLVADDGLPTHVEVWYDPRHPETAVLPEVISTWFAPCALVILGLACSMIGAFLFYWARKPIELPYLPVAAAGA